MAKLKIWQGEKMAGGRPKKSVTELKATGQYRADRHGDRPEESSISTAITGIDPPEQLGEKAKRQWVETVPALCMLNLISQQDIATLVKAFEMLDEAEYIRDKITNNQGHLDIDDYCKLNHAWLKNVKEFNIIMYRFGVTPAQRMQMLSSIKKSEPETDPVMDIVNG